MNTERFLTAGQAKLLQKHSAELLESLRDVIIKESLNGFNVVDLSKNNFNQIDYFFDNYENYSNLLINMGYKVFCSQTIITISWEDTK